MHRQFSFQPFSRHYSHSTNPFLDFLGIEADNVTPGSSPRITVTPEKRADLLKVLRMYKAAHTSGTLLTLTFVTVNDYLWLLRAVSQELSKLGRKALYYLAAAVSDFFLPRQKMVNTPCGGNFGYSFPLSSLYTKSNRVKEVCPLRWTKYLKFSNLWSTNGHPTVTSSRSRWIRRSIHTHDLETKRSPLPLPSS